MSLTPEETNRFRELLEKERDDTRAEIESLEEQMSSPDIIGDDPSDVADASVQLFDQDERLARITRLQRTLERIEMALERIEDGKYGLSVVSGKPIPVERLEVLPYAETLVDEKLPAGDMEVG